MYSTPWDDIFELTDKKYGLPSGMTRAIANAETGHIRDPARRARATSPAGAMGVMQFIPSTAKQYNLQDPFNPEQSIDAGGRYLADLFQKFPGRPDLVAAGYNAGPNRQSLQEGRIPAIKETQQYVPRVLAGMFGGLPSTYAQRLRESGGVDIQGNPSHGSAELPTISPPNTTPNAPVAAPQAATPAGGSQELQEYLKKALLQQQQQRKNAPVMPVGYGDMSMAQAGMASAGAIEPYRDMSSFAVQGGGLPALLSLLNAMRNRRA